AKARIRSKKRARKVHASRVTKVDRVKKQTRRVTRRVKRAAKNDRRLRLRQRGVRKGKLEVVVDVPVEEAPAAEDPSATEEGPTGETPAAETAPEETDGGAQTAPAETDGGATGSVSLDLAPVSKMGPVPSDAYYIAPNGSDGAGGSQAQPWRTIDHAVDSVKPGDTVVILPGTYGELGVTHDLSTSGTSNAPITFRGAPGGEMPKILGHFKIRGSYQRFNYLLFDGPTGQIKTPTADNPNGEQVQVTILGAAVDGIEISDSEIRDSLWHAGIYANAANDVRITGNYIHDNGDPNDPGQENQSHGIYFARGSGLIVNNVITDNIARGIQMYKGPNGLTVANNTVVGNGKTGIQFGNETANSIAVNNLVAYNGEYGIRSSSLTGDNNVVTNNLVWENGSKGETVLTDGLDWRNDNIEANPGFDSASSLTDTSGGATVDASDAEYAPVIDFGGRARSSGEADIGAFEVK
ncbi:MAG: right-handed parallel beta-helix repeat-containing protein, partial [Solirubrobacterales bacterium]